MAASLLQRSKIVWLFDALGKSKVIPVTSYRSVMTSKARLDKVVAELQKNPYYDKYAIKIAKLQETSPEEFLRRTEEKERQLKEKVISSAFKGQPKLQWSYSVIGQLWRSNIIQKQNMVRLYSQVAPKYKYITTPIFYVNDVPHIGHLYTAVLADSISRFYRMQDYETILNTGTDEHGNKVLQAAKFMNLDVEEYCKQISEKFKTMCNTFEVDYTRFIRTTDQTHRETVQYFWKLLEDKNHIYKGKYSGWYCVSDETFLSDQDLTEKVTASGVTVKVSAESGHEVEWAEEDNYKFRLSNFQDDLKHWLKDESVVQPSTFHKILSNWVEEGSCLEDLSISRPINRAPWGIPTPTDPNQTIYVWLDALVNYLSSIGYPNEKFKQFWPPAVQVIGKDILKFHGIYWPAFLIAAGLEPPRTLLCHSHWTVDDKKMSKSKGNVVSPFNAATEFTTSGLRYFLLRDSVPHNDNNYSDQRVQNILNSELSDTLGNLVSRCSSKAVNPTNEIPNVCTYANVLKSEAAENLRTNMESLELTAKRHYESFYTHHVIDAVMSTLKSANAMIEFHKPWLLRKQVNDNEAATELKGVIALALETARISAIILYPIVPTLSNNLLNYLNVAVNARSWKDAKPKYLNDYKLPDTEPFGNEKTMVFPKIRVKV